MQDCVNIYRPRSLDFGGVILSNCDAKWNEHCSELCMKITIVTTSYNFFIGLLSKKLVNAAKYQRNNCGTLNLTATEPWKRQKLKILNWL